MSFCKSLLTFCKAVAEGIGLTEEGAQTLGIPLLVLLSWVICVLYIYRKECCQLSFLLEFVMKCIPWWNIMGNPHFAIISPLMKTQRVERAGRFDGWPPVRPPSRILLSCFWGVLWELFPRPVMLVRASVFPQLLSHNDLSLLTLILGECIASASPHRQKVKPWGHPGRLPDNTLVCTYIVSSPLNKHTFV